MDIRQGSTSAIYRLNVPLRCN